MQRTWPLAPLLAGILLAAPPPAVAQQSQPQTQPRSKPSPRTKMPQPQLREEDTITPAQARRAQEQIPVSAPAAPKAAAPKPAAPAARSVACSGAFSRQSSHMRIAMAFNSENVTFTEVDGPEGSKVLASVLFPKDPKRRLEVWWENEAGRSDTSLIVINGQSTWVGPKGLRLGLTLAALEKLNGKPFKLKGFEKAEGGSVTDWQGGSLTTLPGGCKVGLRMAADPKISADSRSQVATNAEFLSNDPKMQAAKPTVAEILLGYPR
jgi:hypothetical protein